MVKTVKRVSDSSSELGIDSLGYNLKRFPIVAVRRIFTRCGHESQLALNEWGVGTADETAAAHRNM